MKIKLFAVAALVAVSSVAQAQSFFTNLDTITNADAADGGALSGVGSFASGSTTGQAGAAQFTSPVDRVITLANLAGPTPAGTLSLTFSIASAASLFSYDFWASSSAKIGAGTGVLVTLSGPGGSTSVIESGLGSPTAAVPTGLFGNPGPNTGVTGSQPNSGVNHTGTFAGGALGVYTLTFANLPGNNGMRLDDISLVATPVPEAQTLAMMLAGLAALGGVVARRRKSAAA